MRKRFAGISILVLALGLSLLPLQAAMADTGPKPTMDFTFTQSTAGPQPGIIGGTMYECDQADCSDAQPLKQLGPQGFRCDMGSCNATGYGFSTYHRIAVQFTDGKTRKSNIFQTAGFNSSYTVEIRTDDLLVKANTPATTWALAALAVCCCLALLLVLAVVIIVVLRRNSKK